MPEPIPAESVTMYPGPYGWAIRDDPRMTLALYAVASLHRDCADLATGRNIFRSQKKMAEALGLKDYGTVGKYQKVLRQWGYLQVEGRTGRSPIHRLSVPVTSIHAHRGPVKD